MNRIIYEHCYYVSVTNSLKLYATRSTHDVPSTVLMPGDLPMIYLPYQYGLFSLGVTVVAISKAASVT